MSEEEHGVERMTEKEQQLVKEFEEMVLNAKPLDIELDMIGRRIQFDGSGGASDGPRENDRVWIVASEIIDDHGHCFAGIHMNRAQWNELKQIADGLFDAMQRAMDRREEGLAKE